MIWCGLPHEPPVSFMYAGDAMPTGVKESPRARQLPGDQHEISFHVRRFGVETGVAQTPPTSVWTTSTPLLKLLRISKLVQSVALAHERDFGRICVKPTPTPGTCDASLQTPADDVAAADAKFVSLSYVNSPRAVHVPALGQDNFM